MIQMTMQANTELITLISASNEAILDLPKRGCRSDQKVSVSEALSASICRQDHTQKMLMSAISGQLNTRLQG